MEKIREHTVKLNEGIRVQEIRPCLPCGSEGVLLYQNLRDRLFAAPGTWSLMRCLKCDLVWLNPCSAPADIGKLYENYFTFDPSGSTRLMPYTMLESTNGGSIAALLDVLCRVEAIGVPGQ